jgi:hypothetical protein
MWWRRTLLVTVVVPVALVVGLAIWFIAMKGAANHAESACFAGLESRPAYGGYSMSREFWPPTFECRLRGVGVPDLTISHPIAGLAGAFAVVVVPWVLLAGTAASVWWAVRRRPAGHGTRQLSV